MGTAASMGYSFEPIGYSNEIKKIKETIKQNCNHQALFFNIIGDFGYGKTHFLHYFKKVYKNDFQVHEYPLDKFKNLGSFFLEKINKFNKNSKQKKGIIFFIDETQNIFEQENKEELREFRDFLKNFPDAKLKNNNNEYINIGENLKKIIIFLAVHPETAALIFTKKQDVGDRCLTHRLDLKGLNYYSALKIVEKFIELKNQKIEDWFDENIIPLIFCLTPFITHQRYEKYQFNPRIFIEIFYQICEYWRDSYAKGEKLTIRRFLDVLRDEEISIGAASEELSKAILKFNDKKKFERVYEAIVDKDIKYFILTPKWTYLDDILQEKIKENEEFFEIKEGYILDESKFTSVFIRNLEIDNQIKDQIKLLPKICIYFEENPNNASYLVFNDDLKGINYSTLKDIFDNHCIITESFFRLNSEYLKFFYNYEDEFFEEKGLYNYLKSDDKTKFFYDQFKKELAKNEFERLGYFRKIKQQEISYSNVIGENIIKRYLTFESIVFDFIDKWEIYNVYFFIEKEIDTLQQFCDNLYENPKNQENICDIIILEPYIKNYNLNPIELKDFSINKTVIYHPNIEEFKELISDQLKSRKEIIHSYLKNARKIIISMLIDKALIIPLSNLKITKAKTKHHEYFQDIINTALTNKIEKSFSSSIASDEKSFSLKEFKQWLIFDNDINTGKETFSKFFQVDIKKERKTKINRQEQRFYFKNKISDFEIQFLKLLIQLSKNNQNKNVQTDLFSETLNKIITADTRIDFFEFIEFLLIEKQILTKVKEEAGGKKYDVYILKNPKINTKELIKKLNIIIKYDLSPDDKKRYELIINVLNDFLNDKDIEILYFDLKFDDPNEIVNIKSILNKFSIINYYCKRIEDSLEQNYITIDDDLLNQLFSKVKSIIENINITKTIKNEVNEEKSISLCFFDFILQEISNHEKEISKVKKILYKIYLDKTEEQDTIENSSENIENNTNSEEKLNYYDLFILLNFIFLMYFYDENLDYDEFSQEIANNDEKLNYILSKLKGINELEDLSDYINDNEITDEIGIKFNKIFQDFDKLVEIFDISKSNYESIEESEEIEEEAYISEDVEYIDDDFEEFTEFEFEEYDEEQEEEEYEVILVPISLVENLLEFFEVIDNEISNKKSFYDNLVNNITETLKEVKKFVIEKQPLFMDLNFIIALKNNNFITYDRLLENLFKNFDSNYYYFNYNEEFENFNRLLVSNYQFAQFYNDFINKALSLINQNNEFFLEFLLICDNIKDNEIVSEIYGLLSNLEDEESEEAETVIQNIEREDVIENVQLIDYNELSKIEQFIWLYLYIHGNDIARNFLYFFIFKEINERLHNIDVIDNKKIDFKAGYEDFYKDSLMNKRVSIIYKYDSVNKQDVATEPITTIILASKDDIISYYRNIIKGKEIKISKIIEIKNYIISEYPQYLLFKYYEKDLKSQSYYCPLESNKSDAFSLNYFKLSDLESILEEIINDLKLDHVIGSIKVDDQEKFKIIDDNENKISMYFIHPLMELKEKIRKNEFGIDQDFKLLDLKNKIKDTSINFIDFVNDIIQNLITNDFNLNECYGKTKNYFNNNIAIKIEEIKFLCDFYENELGEIISFLKSD